MPSVQSEQTQSQAIMGQRRSIASPGKPAKNITWSPENPDSSELSAGASVLPKFLRGLGVMTLLISVSVYLFQGWGESSDLMRYFLLLGHTVALAGVGLFCSRYLNEQKSARILLMMTLTFVSANFAIIAGFLYSVWGGPSEGLHGAVTWVLADDLVSMVVMAVSLVVLVPLSNIGFKVLARRSAHRFTWIFLLANFALLIPTRIELIIGAMLLVMGALIVMQISKARRDDVTLSTREGAVAQLIPCVPLIIMLGRNMMHDMGAVMPMIISAALLVFCRQVSLSLAGDSALRRFIELASPVSSLFINKKALRN